MDPADPVHAAGGQPGPVESLSVAIVCRDNGSTIGRTLDSVRGLAGEIVAVDSGSTDSTIGLLESAGARVIRSDWLGYVKTKQKALEACGRDWVLCLDSDESVEPELDRSVRAFLASPGGASGALVNRKVWYRGRFLEHVWQPEWRLRLVRRAAARWGGLDPHDKLEVVGGTTRLAGDLRHDSFESFAEHLETQSRHARVMAQSLFDSGVRVGRARPFASAAGALFKHAVARGGWRDGAAGWLAAYSTAAGAMMKHAALLELQENARSGANR